MATQNARKQDPQEALIDDLRDVLADTEAMIDDVTAQGGEKALALRGKIADNLRAVRSRLYDAEQKVAGKAKEAARATDTYVHDHPWQSVGVAAGVGFLLGLLVSRR
ncbi:MULTISPECIES: DUF883 family protein [Microvirgula]|uniref:DUF883 domain-containing protein n=1 Tax=Microvirgula aerodenitrificans TaxID=57480 RepID=A0A2S0PAQ0_9NEIS|nr:MULTISPECIES: DUF883 family protein [Microvirgula]AVY94412.1 DUF883 domain-containing protein [Microvirgula aerodenitrificans]RAS19170.1 ElaB/YqjD/DUF883 family membrane-anchored ribosome-binding protein [Microvirgula sp. AG722]